MTDDRGQMMDDGRQKAEDRRPSALLYPLSSVFRLLSSGRVLGALIVLGSAVLIQQWLMNKETLPIRFVRVEGTFQHLQPSGVKDRMIPLVDAGYFSVSLSAVKDAVLALPWVNAVYVKRIWPDTLVVRIDEQRPYVRWGSGSLLNEHGERFTPDNVEAFRRLPLLQGREGEENALFGMLNKVTQTLAEQGLRVDALMVSERRAWTIRLASGLIIKMGRRHPWRALDRFLRTMPLLKDERQAIHSVDLRYPNGFAVSWKPGTELEWHTERGSYRRTPGWVAGL